MHKLIEYICDELDELEKKADKGGKLTTAELQYGDTLAHFKKNLLTAEAMMDADSEHSYDDQSYARGGNRRGGRRGANQYGSYARGNYSRDMYSRERGYSMSSEDLADELRNLMDDAPDEHTKQEFRKFIDKIERM